MTPGPRCSLAAATRVVIHIATAAWAFAASACSSAGPGSSVAPPDGAGPGEFAQLPATPAGQYPGGSAGATPPGPGTTEQGGEDGPPPGPLDSSPRSNPEVVYVLLYGRHGYEIGFCTGTLIAADLVLTAGHCLDPSEFGNAGFGGAAIVAPHAPGSPQVRSRNTRIYDTSWRDIAHPDLGIIKLAGSVNLSQYAVLTDVSARVDAGRRTYVGAVVRTAETVRAPLHAVGPMQLSAATDQGYPHSYSVPLFSQGGDSGAGVFLVENGKLTHKVVAVEHDPDPANQVDHISRVDAEFIQWVASTSPTM